MGHGEKHQETHCSLPRNKESKSLSPDSEKKVGHRGSGVASHKVPLSILSKSLLLQRTKE